MSIPLAVLYSPSARTSPHRLRFHHSIPTVLSHIPSLHHLRRLNTQPIAFTNILLVLVLYFSLAHILTGELFIIQVLDKCRCFGARVILGKDQTERYY